MIEHLESRIAPATLTGRVLKYIEADGDAVTVTFTKGTLTAANFVFDNAFATTGAQELQRIDVSSLADVEGSNITVAVRKAVNGDGIASIGAIIATGRDLGVVKVKGNLGSIAAGNDAQPAPGLASLSVGTLGLVGTSMQAPLGSTITGAAISVTITGDLGNQVSASSLGTLKIGGSLIGNGRIFVNGDAMKATIGGSMMTDPGGNELDFYVLGNLGSLTVKRSVIDGEINSNLTSPLIFVEGNAGSIAIAGDLIGPSGTSAHQTIKVNGAVGSFTVGGSVVGSADLGINLQFAHMVNTFGQGVGSVLIKGSAYNMTLGVSVGLTNSQSILKSFTVNGSFVSSGIAVSGTTGADMKFGTADDVIAPASSIGSFTVKGSVYGSAKAGDSFAINAGKVVKAKIGARLLPLAGGTQTLSIASSGDVFMRDIV